MRRTAHAWLNLLWTMTLVAGLTLLAALLGCEPPSEDEDPAAYYGPAPYTDGGLPDSGRPDACAPAAYYGPQPCGSDEDCSSRHGEGWYCDLANSYGDGCGNTTPWPLCRESVDAGAPDSGADAGCEPAAYYGPIECTGDSDCEQQHGAGWYCELDPSTPCAGGGWCRESVDAGTPDAGVPDACEPAAYYGPQPCQSNQECVTQYGEGWYCDEQNQAADGCGNTVVWPVCKQQ